MITSTGAPGSIQYYRMAVPASHGPTYRIAVNLVAQMACHGLGRSLSLARR